MDRTWNLEALYSGYETTAFKEAVATLESFVEKADRFKDTLDSLENADKKLLEYINLASELRSRFLKVYAFVNLNLATNAKDEASNAWMNHLQKLSSKTTAFTTKVAKFVPRINDLDELIAQHDALKPYAFHLKSIKDRARYVLSDKEEMLIAKLSQTGSSAWGRLQGLLTSVVEVPYEDKVLTLPQVRNLAHAKDPEVRKKAYEAELAAYKQIDESIAFALNGVKGEVLEVSQLRGYESPLHEAVYNARMQKDTLDALITSMRKHVPLFQKYLRRKAELLGHKNGLPWYDLFAPLGESERTFTPDEAVDYIEKNFQSFGDDLARLARRAHNESWIDYTPRSGKRGGAFCMNLHPIKQSRILMNFDGSFSNVITLAHELGHAYHGDRIFKEAILNASYTMPVAETASTLCETIVKKAAVKEAEGDEKLFILEQSLMGSTQVIIDILSRYLFEESVFEERQKTPLSVKRLNTLMLEAQKATYGDALNQDTLHPYMWANKGHYYSGTLSFYNFPYAYGLLFAKGIYAKFQEHGKPFAEKIDLLLQKTGQMSIEDVAALVDIDVRDVSFWDQSLAVIGEEIETFLAITA